MQIRNKLTLQFTAIVAIIMIVFSFSIYYFAEHFRHKNFNNRLKEKALNTVNLLVEVEEIDLALLKTLRRDYLASLPGEFVRVYDNNNLPIYRDDTISFRLTKGQLDDVRAKGEVQFTVKERQVVGITYKDKYRITASAIDLDGKRQMDDLRLIILVGNLLCLIIILISGRFFAIQSLKPIAKINQDAAIINENNLGMRLDEGQSKDEISMLAVTFNKLFNRLHDAFERQKRFVSHASHELRTPLTTITGEIEVSLMKERSKEEYVEVLLSVLDEAKTLTKLSNGLLQLAQAGETKSILAETINIYILLERIKEEVLKRFGENKLQVIYNETIPISHIAIHGNEELLKIALMNIIENAFKFSLNQPVFLRIDITEINVYLKIIDSGRGISKEDMEHISQPFYRAENATDIPGHGIGLSLSEKIIELHEGKLNISSAPKQGTIISIALPRLDYELN